MTDAKKGRGSDEFHSEYKKNAGADYSAFSFHESTKDDAKWRDEGRTGDVSHTSVFTVDFANKTLTGELSRHKSKSEKVKRYDIKADIKDNRFRGSATASNPNDPFFKSNSKSLEGGFLGQMPKSLRANSWLMTILCLLCLGQDSIKMENGMTSPLPKKPLMRSSLALMSLTKAVLIPLAMPQNW